MLIRSVEQADTQPLIDLAQRMHSESAYAALPFDPRYVELLILQTINEPNYFGRVAIHDDTIVGMFAAHLSSYFFGPGLIAVDLVSYVIPELRGSSAFIRMLHEYTQWARSSGALEIQVGVSTGINTEKVGHMYERLGFTKVGTLHKMKEN